MSHRAIALFEIPANEHLDIHPFAVDLCPATAILYDKDRLVLGEVAVALRADSEGVTLASGAPVILVTKNGFPAYIRYEPIARSLYPWWRPGVGIEICLSLATSVVIGHTMTLVHPDDRIMSLGLAPNTRIR